MSSNILYICVYNIYIYIYIYIYIILIYLYILFICIYIYIFIQICIYLYIICIFIYIYKHIYIYLLTFVFIYLYIICIFVYIYKYIYIYIFIYICIYIYIYIYILGSRYCYCNNVRLFSKIIKNTFFLFCKYFAVISVASSFPAEAKGIRGLSASKVFIAHEGLTQFDFPYIVFRTVSRILHSEEATEGCSFKQEQVVLKIIHWQMQS